MSTTREQFVQHVIDIVRDKFPVAKVARAEQPFSLQVNGQIASLENLYRSSALHPQKTREMIEQWMLELVRASEGPPDLNGTYEELSDRLLPMVLSEDQTGSGAAAMVYQPLVAGLVVGYAIDGPRSLWYVTEPTAARWQIDIDAMHERAIQNLVAKSEAIAAQAAQDAEGQVNLILFQTLDGLDASRLLLPTLHERLREHLGSPFVAGVPNRDILLCFRDDPPHVERLRQQIASDYKQMPHPVTDKLLLITPDGIAPHE